MKRTVLAVVTAIIACIHCTTTPVTIVAGSAVVVGCAAKATKQNLGLPAISETSTRVEKFVAWGIEAGSAITTEDAAQFFVAVKSKDRARVTAAFVTWPAIAGAADMGIEAQLLAGKIGPVGAGIFHEEVVNFGDVLQQVSTGR